MSAGSKQFPAAPVKIKRLRGDATIPHYATEGAAAADLAVPTNEQAFIIAAGGVATVHLGFAVEIPPGYAMQILPRSGLARNHNIDVANSPGLIDSDYRGEVCVLLRNNGDFGFNVLPGTRIAQAILVKIPAMSFEAAEELSETRRGDGGFGSTGTQAAA